MKIVDKHEPREYSAMATSSGVVLCDKNEGAFLVLRCVEDATRLAALLDEIQVMQWRSPEAGSAASGSAFSADEGAALRSLAEALTKDNGLLRDLPG